MLLILFVLITFNSVFGGKCPPKEIFSPCKCEIEYVSINIIY